MSMEPIIEVGVGGIFALMLIRSVLDFLAKKKNGTSDKEIMEMRVVLAKLAESDTKQTLILERLQSQSDKTLDLLQNVR